MERLSIWRECSIMTSTLTWLVTFCFKPSSSRALRAKSPPLNALWKRCGVDGCVHDAEDPLGSRSSMRVWLPSSGRDWQWNKVPPTIMLLPELP
ncbi:hypothetical protein BDN71DRAFT_1458578 [Pleurotus eryngii]|uniref:Uncharacterized protein n=1 Tax=Pleurotus eryngii TaxID=5323 RepID=A0A9P6D973_PLEER|nr:hypothetical protein BDN71DRAFT_1458578 [Pleurotus eryngii]